MAVELMTIGVAAAANPVDQILRSAREPRLFAEAAKQVGRHRFRAPVSTCDKAANLSCPRMDECTEVRMMDEAAAARPQLTRRLREVRAHSVCFGVHERVEAENEIDAAI